MQDINQRIRLIMDNMQMTASAFADSLHIPRPAMSHVLNGRNKPGLEFIEKISRTYPSIRIEWILTGEGEMMKKSKAAAVEQITQQFIETPNNPPRVQMDIFSELQRMNDPSVDSFPVRIEPKEPKQTSKTEESYNQKHKKLIKIVLIYDNHTFAEITPDSDGQI